VSFAKIVIWLAEDADANDSQDMGSDADNQIETPNQLQMTPEQQQILPPPADSAQAQPTMEGEAATQAPTHPQHWGALYPRPQQPTPQPTDVQPH